MQADIRALQKEAGHIRIKARILSLNEEQFDQLEDYCRAEKYEVNKVIDQLIGRLLLLVK